MAVVVSVADLKLQRHGLALRGPRPRLAGVVLHHRAPAGTRVPLHRHPYEETFIVQEGVAEFTVDAETITAEAGKVVIVPAGAAHGFASVGDGLRQVSIHPSGHVIQEGWS